MWCTYFLSQLHVYLIINLRAIIYLTTFLHLHHQNQLALNMDVEHVADPITWWYECCTSFLCLSHMALDYLTIPGMPSFLFHAVLVAHTIILCSYIY